MSVRTRLALAFAAVVFVLALPSVYGVSRLAALRDIVVEIEGRHARALRALAALQAGIERMDRLQRSYVITGDPRFRAPIRKLQARNGEAVARLRRAGYAGEAEAVAHGLRTLDEASRRLARLLQSGRRAEATAVFNDVEPLFRDVERGLDRIAAAIDRQSARGVQAAHQISSTASATALLALLAALGLAGIVGLWVRRSLIPPLQRLRQSMATVVGDRRGGGAVPTLPFERTDEIGDLARSFRTMIEQFEALERMRAEFLSMASHDLKTPIGVIHGYAEVLAAGIHGEVNEKQREVLDIIKEQAQVLSGLVGHLMDVGRVEAGGFRVEPRPFRTEPFFSDLERAFRVFARQNRVALKVWVDPAVPDTLMADPDRLRDKVLANLISNAFKFTPSGGEVSVHVAWAESHVHIAVADTGAGIPQDELPHVFDAYYQTENGGRGGAGLGLAIARQVVHAHGGTLTVESEPGRGTTFHVTLPAGREAVGSAARRLPRPGRPVNSVAGNADRT